MKRDQSGCTWDHQFATASAVAVVAFVPDGIGVDPPEVGAALAGAVLDGEVVGDDRPRVVVEPPPPAAEADDPPPVVPEAADPGSLFEPLLEPVVPAASRPPEPPRSLPDVAEWAAGG